MSLRGLKVGVEWFHACHWARQGCCMVLCCCQCGPKASLSACNVAGGWWAACCLGAGGGGGGVRTAMHARTSCGCRVWLSSLIVFAVFSRYYVGVDARLLRYIVARSWACVQPVTDMLTVACWQSPPDGPAAASTYIQSQKHSVHSAGAAQTVWVSASASALFTSNCSASQPAVAGSPLGTHKWRVLG